MSPSESMRLLLTVAAFATGWYVLRAYEYAIEYDETNADGQSQDSELDDWMPVMLCAIACDH